MNQKATGGSDVSNHKLFLHEQSRWKYLIRQEKKNKDRYSRETLFSLPSVQRLRGGLRKSCLRFDWSCYCCCCRLPSKPRYQCWKPKLEAQISLQLDANKERRTNKKKSNNICILAAWSTVDLCWITQFYQKNYVTVKINNKTFKGAAAEEFCNNLVSWPV